MGLWLTGCNPPTSRPSSDQGTGKAENLPPLKVALVEAAELESELSLRWQSFSDQKLQVVPMNRGDFSSQEVSTVDVIIYPADFIGTLVDRDWIATVPNQVRDRIGGWSSRVDGENAEPSLVSAWPTRWRALSMFGGKPMAVPLGAPSWIAIARDLDCQPLLDLHTLISSNQVTAEACTKLWNQFLERALTKASSSPEEREAELMRRLESVSTEEKRALTSRFLWLVSSTESRYRGAFDLYKIQARWNQPEFARSARHLRQLALLQPSTILASPEDAWESVANGDALFAIGWPRTDSQQRLESSSRAPATRALVPIVWNSGSGLLASLGRRTRQSANAAQFLAWLSSDEQRAAMQSKTSRVELVEIDNDPNRTREDYRDYQTMQRLESGNISLELTPRFANSEAFLSLLGDALLDIFRDPDATEARLLQCRQDWDALVDQVGREKLRANLEAASGYAR